MKTLGKIVRSVQAFGRGLSRAAPPPVAKPAPRIGLALGGGFARGIAHIGILKVLEAEKIPLSMVAGTSAGALIGAGYCSGVTPAELEEIALRMRFKQFARWTLSRHGFATNQRMIGFLNNMLKVKTFEELRLPLAVTATDLNSGEGVVFRSGPLVDAVRASCAYPGMFLPVNLHGRWLVDGMLSYTVPTQPLRAMGAERVLAVHLRGRWLDGDGPRHIFDVIGQCFAIAQEMNASVWKTAADLVVEPDVNGFDYDAFERTAELVHAGEVAMRRALPQVRAWLAAQAQPAAAPGRKVEAAQPAPLPVD